MFISLKVEVQVQKLHCVSRAEPIPFKIEDAARSEADIEKASQVHPLIRISLHFLLSFAESSYNLVLLHIFGYLHVYLLLDHMIGAGWRTACSDFSAYSFEQ